jgi:hypothetical protein
MKVTGYIVSRPEAPVLKVKKIHSTLNAAKNEAQKLCEKENAIFNVSKIAVVGKYKPAGAPVVWEDEA